MNRENDSNLESRLDPGGFGTPVEWQQLRDSLASSFAEYLGQEIEMVWEPAYEDVAVTWGFTFGIRSRVPLGGPLAIEWYGIISHNNHGHTAASILLFAQDQRVMVAEQQQYLYFEFLPAGSGPREWQNRGWNASETHEWDKCRLLSEICRQGREARGTQR